MIEPTLWFVAGLVALIGGAELLVRYISKFARALGIPKLIVALTIVAFGTSAPELAVSIQAGIDGNTDLMLGNIVGSNISNTLLILGLAALFIPLKVHTNLIKVDGPIMLAITLLVYVLALNGIISFWDCVLLSAILAIYLIYLIRQGSNSDDSRPAKIDRTPLKITVYLVLSGAGLVLLISGARWLIDSSLIFAEMAGVSELIIGLTVVAIGTSLPEIVVTLVAAIKRERDLAVGSVIGSNILNFLAVLGISGLFITDGIPVQDVLLQFDMLVLIGVTLICFPIFYTGHKIVRWEGALLVFFYFSYIFYLFLSSTEHSAENIFAGMMFYFVIPVTVITLLVISVIEWKKRYRFRGFGSSGKNQE